MASDTVGKVKDILTIKHTALDGEIADQIAACIKDLQLAGIADPSEEDPIILSAIKNWCRSEYEEDVNKAKAFRDAYDAQKACLITASGYGLPADG